MSTDLVVIIPSHGRPSSVERQACAFAETGAEDLAVVYAVETNDPALGEYEAAVTEWFGYGEVLQVEARGMSPAVNIAGRHVLGDLDPFAVAVLHDDHLPRTEGWAERLVAELRGMGTGVVYPSDGANGARLMTSWAMTSNIIGAIHRVVPALVGHQYAGSALQSLASEAGVLRYMPEVLIEHMHPSVKKAKADKGYIRVNSQYRRQVDGAAYRKWERSERRGVQLERIAALRADALAELVGGGEDG